MYTPNKCDAGCDVDRNRERERDAMPSASARPKLVRQDAGFYHELVREFVTFRQAAHKMRSGELCVRVAANKNKNLV
jgi:hypothetical protein